MKPKYWNSEKIVSFAAIFISLLTLIVFLYQTNLIKKQQYMSVYPHLSLENAGTNTKSYKYLLTNNGVGPALIKSVEVQVKNGKTYTDIEPYVKANLTMKDSVKYYYANISTGMLIPEKNSIELIETVDNTYKTSNILHKILNSEDVNIKIEYESIYGECWIITNQSKLPKKL